MSTSIHRDDSVVVRLGGRTIQFDPMTQAIHLRSRSNTEIGGAIEASFPFAAADKVRLWPGQLDEFYMALTLLSGASIRLGSAPSRDAAMLAARAIANLTRCKVEMSQGTVRELPGPSSQFCEADTMEDCTLARFLRADPRPEDEPTRPIEIAGLVVPRPRPLLSEETGAIPLVPETLEAERVITQPDRPSRQTAEDISSSIFEPLLRESEIHAAVAPDLVDRLESAAESLPVAPIDLVPGWGF